MRPALGGYEPTHYRVGTDSNPALEVEHPRGRSDPSGRGSLLVLLRLGLDHVLGRLDHLAFVLAPWWLVERI